MQRTQRLAGDLWTWDVLAPTGHGAACTEVRRMGWVFLIAASWLLVGLSLAVVIGRSVRHADRTAAQDPADTPNFVVDQRPAVSTPDAPLGGGRTTVPHNTDAETRPPPPAPPGSAAPTIPGL